MWNNLTNWNWWFGDNSIVGKNVSWSKDKINDLGDANWWFGDNSFWGVLDVSELSYGNYGISFHDKNKSNLSNILPLAVLGLIGIWVIKKL